MTVRIPALPKFGYMSASGLFLLVAIVALGIADISISAQPLGRDAAVARRLGTSRLPVGRPRIDTMRALLIRLSEAPSQTSAGVVLAPKEWLACKA